ncbi:hypothetical protein [Phormidesmis sp. 146-33]
MSEETQQPDSEKLDVVRSPKNTDRDLEAERAGNPTDAPEVVRKLVVIDDEPDDSPKNDRPVDLTKLDQTVDISEVVRKPVVIDPQSATDESDRSPKNDRDFKS